MRRPLGLELDAASGLPTAALSGTLRDAGSGIGLGELAGGPLAAARLRPRRRLRPLLPGDRPQCFVTDFLSQRLDWTTLRVEEIAFGDVVIGNPAATPDFAARATLPDYRPGDDRIWWVDASSALDGLSGHLEVSLRMLDPLTGELPQDPFAGLLPPNDASHRGEGHVRLTIETLPDLALGTVVTNQASIVFDLNEAIVTNEVFNTIQELDRAPELIPPADQFVLKDAPVDLQIYAYDADEDPVSYSAVGLPAGSDPRPEFGPRHRQGDGVLPMHRDADGVGWSSD